MTNILSQEEEKKKAIFDGMSARQKERILKKGYGNWDPFINPREPIDIKQDKNKLTALEVTRLYLRSLKDKDISKAYMQGIWEICMGIFSQSDRYMGMYEFSCWYEDFSNKNKNAGNK